MFEHREFQVDALLVHLSYESEHIVNSLGASGAPRWGQGQIWIWADLDTELAAPEPLAKHYLLILRTVRFAITGGGRGP